MSSPPGLQSRRSPDDVAQTVRRFRAAAEAAGLTVFNEVDHGGNAAAVGLELRPAVLLEFGNPRAGTLLMQLGQTTGIDLPLKALIFADESGATWIAWNDPQWIAERHDLGAGASATLAAMAAAMAKLVAEATSPPP